MPKNQVKTKTGQQIYVTMFKNHWATKFATNENLLSTIYDSGKYLGEPWEYITVVGCIIIILFN